MPSVVVASQSSDADSIAETLRSGGATQVDADPQTDGRVVTTGWIDDPDQASGLAAALRADGLAAVQGPGSHEQVDTWAEHSSPVELADGTCVAFPWSRFDASAFERVVFVDPGGGFGAPRHPTTRLALELLPSDLSGATVLDVGCGSGVLGLVAAARGATVTAIDVADKAVATTNANAEANGLAARLTASTTPIAEIVGTYDVVVANIWAEILTDLAPELVRVTGDGTLIVGGLSAAQRPIVLNDLGAPEVTAERSAGHWVACALRPGA